MTKLLVASRNRKKLAELRRVLDGAGLSGLTLLSLGDVSPLPETPETGVTFEDNALAKARDAFSATGLASVADDSGLEVAALGGSLACCRPGGPAGMATMPRTPRCCWRSCAMCPMSGAEQRSCRPARWSRGPAKLSCAVNGPARSPVSRAVTAGSATTRSSSRTVTTAQRPS